MDEYYFYINSNFEIIKEDNNENVLLTLNDPKGNAVIIQKKINLLKTTLFKDLPQNETLTSMHRTKFQSFIKLMNGYDADKVVVDKIGRISFARQSFKYMEEDHELAYDIRVVQIANDYYAFYNFGQAKYIDRNIKVVDQIIGSLSKENLYK